MATMIKPTWDEVTTTYRRAVPLQPGNGEPIPEQFRSNGVENWHHHLRLVIQGRAFDIQEAPRLLGFLLSTNLPKIGVQLIHETR